MTGPAMIESVRAFESRLSVPVSGWRRAVAGWSFESRTWEALIDALVLPLRRIAPELLDLDAVVGEAARVLARSPEAEMCQQVKRRLQNLVVELLSSEPDVLRGLSDMAREMAAYRTLISSGDRFDVSVASVLGAVALSNYAHALDHFRHHHARPLEQRKWTAIFRPLAWLAEGRIALRPGDLWFLDLAARTVCLSEKILPAEALPIGRSAGAPASARELVQLAAPRFVAVSLLAKLLSTGRLPGWLLQKAQYKRWPGIELLVADAGAESARNVVVGELARQVAADGAKLAHAALIRFLAALLQFDQPAAQLKASLFIADLFWEMLECDDKLLGRLYAQPKLVPTLQAALAAVEQPLDRFADLPEDRSRLAETRSLLRTIDQYRAFVSLAAAASTGKPAAGAKTTS